MESFINDELIYDEKEIENWKCDEKYDIEKLMEKSPSISYPRDQGLHSVDSHQGINIPIKPIVPLEPQDNKSNISEEIFLKKKKN